MDKVSVIIPIYNSAKVLDKTIYSIINQTYKQIELILINDGSIDNSLKICQKWQTKHNNIIIINKKNEGVDYARYDGIKVASGDYLVFCDADDWYEPNGIELLVKTIITNKVDIVYGNSFRVYSSKLNIRKKRFFNKDVVGRPILGTEKKDYMVSFFGTGPIPVSIWAGIYKSNLFTNSLIKTGIKFGEDAFLNLQLYNQANSIFILDEYVYNYRVGGGTSSIPIDIMESCRMGYKFRIDFCNKFNYELGKIPAIKGLYFCLRGFINSLPFQHYNQEKCIQILNDELIRSEYDDLVKLMDLPGIYQDHLSNLIYKKDAKNIYKHALKYSKNPKIRLKHYIKKYTISIINKIFS